MEQFANLAFTTLNGGITNSAGTLIVNDASKFPTLGEFRLLIDSEIIVVGVVSGNTFGSLQRGWESTAAASHANGAAVTCILTEDAISCFRRDNAQLGSYVNMATAVKDGRLMFLTDAPFLLKDKGTSFLHKGPFYRLKKIDNSQFVWANQGPATVTLQNGGVLLKTPQNSALNINIRKKAAPTTPYKVKMLAYPFLNPQNYNLAGMCFRESSTGKICSIEWVWTGSPSPSIQFDNWANTSTQSAGFMSYSCRYIGQDINWFQLENDGTNLTFGYGVDGFNFFPMKVVAKNNFFTTGPDEIGFMVAAWNNFVGAGMFVVSWEEY